jgi:hypothetical protein
MEQVNTFILRQNVDAIEELVHPEFLDRDPTPVASRDSTSMKQFIHTITQTFPDRHHAIFQRKGFANEDLAVRRSLIPQNFISNAMGDWFK